MSYVKQNFVDGQKLTAEHLNHIEDGIVNTSEANINLTIEQNLTDEQKLQVKSNISFDKKWHRFTHPYIKLTHMVSYDDNFNMELANTMLNVTGYGDQCSPIEDIVDVVVRIYILNHSTADNYQTLWHDFAKRYLVPNFDAMEAAGCFKDATTSSYFYINDMEYFVIRRSDASKYAFVLNSGYGKANGSFEYDSATDVFTSFHLSPKAWLDNTLTKPYYSANAKAVGDALAEKITTPATAEVGQTIVVSAVDENGKPTEWKAADIQPKTLVVTFADDLNSADVSALDAISHFECGGEVIGMLNGVKYEAYSVEGSYAIHFRAIDYSWLSENGSVTHLTIRENNINYLDGEGIFTEDKTITLS